MIERLYKLLFIFAVFGCEKHLHYKMVTVNGEKGCVEGVMSEKMANQLKATFGKCKDVNCIYYRGKIKLPFCCEITGYSCNEYI
jgi:hypothetical protein